MRPRASLSVWPHHVPHPTGALLIKLGTSLAWILPLIEAIFYKLTSAHEPDTGTASLQCASPSPVCIHHGLFGWKRGKTMPLGPQFDAQREYSLAPVGCNSMSSVGQTLAIPVFKLA
ncbi:hypothetical protein C8R47DRAFT_721525 [Mycena vitilis]|nr:hypothetical protein C8R47DRAFT_721525 [Mycena vitilis]